MLPQAQHISLEEKQRLMSLVREGAAFTPGDEGLLRSLVDRWPWFHAGWGLLALWELRSNPDRFQDHLPQFSLRFGHRQHLFMLQRKHLFQQEESPRPIAVPVTTAPALALDGDTGDRTAFLEELVRKRLEAIAREKAGLPPVNAPKPPAKEEIIERFLKSEPRIRPRTDIAPEPDEKAERSLKEEGKLVSETLARIHENQGNYRRAIEIYRALSLKYPQKSTYFAAQIEKLEEKLKP